MIRRFLLYSAFIFVSALCSFGQCVGSCTTVTGTITDANSQVWANATITINIVPPFSNPAPLLNNGVPVASPINTITANSSGQFTISLDDNNVVTPKGSKWNFIICPNATVATCSQGQVVVTGTSVNLSTTLNGFLSVPFVNAAPSILRAYNDNEANGGQRTLYSKTSDTPFRPGSIRRCPANR